MRRILRRTLLGVFSPGQRVFEIGCGTEIDAIWLATRGVEVVATDISGKMLLQVDAKAAAAGLSDRIHCRQLAAREIGSLADVFGEHAFDGGFCHAGALNMEPDIGRVPDGIRRLLKQRGHFVLSVINKTSLFELLFYTFLFRPRKAFRRLDNIVPIPISRKGPLDRYVVAARFFSPHEVEQLFGEGFRVEAVEGLQIFLPPSNLADYFSAIAPIF